MLGPLTVRADDGTPVEVTGARLRTLLILLALDPGRVVTLGTLVDGVWGADPPAEAANALQALVSRLRRTGLTIESRPTGYRLAVAADDVDTCRFERLAAAGHATLASDPVATATALREALALWRGPALADAATAAFAQAPVARLTELRLAAIGDRVEAELQSGTDLVAELESLVAEHPLRERFAGLLMRALCRAGRAADALAVYARTRALLADELGADPSAELTALHTDVLRGGLDPRPARRRTNLRSGLTTFVGRDEELSRVAAMVGESRLVTLTGPGGSGKTRLATEVGRTLVDRQPDGVWFVELAPVSDGAEVPHAVLGALGLRAQTLVGGAVRTVPEVTEPMDRLAAALSTRPLLLVLDNCEHLVAAAAALADRLLGECPRLRILATSREPLGITGETLWPVDPLALPPADVDPRHALTFPAMRLLADRARAVRPDFTVDDTTAATMGHVCRALDGMPLAIELAAARLRTMSLDQLATRLDDRFRLLTGGSRMALPRHQTLRAVVDWSWDLLDDDERMLLRRLSVFAGGATLAAAEQVCAGAGLDADRVFDLLTALVDKSLVLVAGDRYRLLETIKAYGRERLAAAGETDRLLAAFVECFRVLAETAEPHLRRAEQLEWLARLEAEHDNLHAAVRTAITTGDATAAHRLAANAGWYWWLHGHKVEGADLAAEVVSMRGEVPPADRALALGLAAMLAVDGVYDQTRGLAWFGESVELARATDRSHPLLRLVVMLNEVLRSYRRSTEELRSLLADLLVTDEDPWVLGTVRVLRAHASLNAGLQHEEAEADFRAALAAFRSVGERWGLSFTLCSLADLVAWRGDFATAIGYYEEASRLIAELVTNEDLVRYRLRLAALHAQLGATEEANAVLAMAQRDAERSGMPESLAGVTHARGDVARLAGDFPAARRHLEQTLTLSGTFITRRQQNIAPQFSALIYASFGFLDTAVDDLDAALAHHTTALTLAVDSNDAPVIAQVLLGVADVTLHRGDPRRAALLLGASEGIRGVPDLSLPDHPRVTAEIRAALGDQEYAETVERGRTTTIDELGALAGIASLT
jgi:predicted ATPase/DNA-binding SARP family transcriptional activator